MKKRVIAALLCACLLTTALGLGEGLLPTLTDTYGVPMPSLIEVLNRYPDSEETDSKGAAVENWTGVTEEDFNAFGVLLKKQGAKLDGYTVTGNVFEGIIAKGGRSFTLVFDTENSEAKVIYPAGTYNERLYDVKAIWNKAEAAETAGRYDEAREEYARLIAYKDAKVPYRDADQCILRCFYEEGEAKRAVQDWDGAVAAFEKAGNYSDAETEVLATRYAEGEAKRAVQDWNGAVAAYEQAGSYSDAKTQILATRYAEGEAKRTAQDWEGAAEAFTKAGSLAMRKHRSQKHAISRR